MNNFIKKVNNTKKVYWREKMKKSVLTISILVLFILGSIAGFLIVKKTFTQDKNENIEIAEQNNEAVSDECTEEYNDIELNTDEIEETSVESEKISPNCSIKLRRYYKECGHTIEQYLSIPTDLVNKTEDDLKKEYEGWNIEYFSKNQIILYREIENECGEHYILKEKDGKIAIYLKVGDEEQFVEDTNVSVEFLPDEDKNKLKEGIAANGRAELNQLIEDYE